MNIASNRKNLEIILIGIGLIGIKLFLGQNLFNIYIIHIIGILK